MQTVELKIAPKDWIYITIIGAFFGFFISLCFYFISYDLQNVSTIIFSTATAVFISLFAFFLITVSNKFILPKVNQKFWYLISFVFSFLSGFLGFSFSFLLVLLDKYLQISQRHRSCKYESLSIFAFHVPKHFELLSGLYALAYSAQSQLS